MCLSNRNEYQLPQQLWQQWPFLQPQHAASLALVLQPQHAASLALVLQPISTITKKSVKEGHAFYGREGRIITSAALASAAAFSSAAFFCYADKKHQQKKKEKKRRVVSME